MVALRNSQHYCSVSAFSPIVAPSLVPWGKKTFSAYLGDNTVYWKAYDTLELLNNAESILPLQIDYDLYIHQGYDHSYYFVASFIGEHIAFHAKYLNA